MSPPVLARQGSSLRLMFVTDEAAQEVASVLLQCARNFDNAGYPEKRDVLRRHIAALEAAK
jgi:hypothetical protein